MNCYAILLFAAMLLASAVASPLALEPPTVSERKTHRNTRDIFHSNPPFKPGTTEALHFTNGPSYNYSNNWAGAVLVGNNYTSVTAEFIAPIPKLPAHAFPLSQYCGAMWVGIDGNTCKGVVLQTGIKFCIQGSNVTYKAWYEWFPDYSHDWLEFHISSGDRIRATVDASSLKSGIATIENLSTGRSVNHTFTTDVQADLCEWNAEWIVENYGSALGLFSFADFGTVEFFNAQARANCSTSGPSDAAKILDIKQDRIYTSTNVTCKNVTVSYVP
ncbi:unnamed protein product [Penicillium salamii]|nr:unnamed protein product [Penicillium salamii]